VTAVSTRRLDFSLGTHNVSNTISGNILTGDEGEIEKLWIQSDQNFDLA